MNTEIKIPKDCDVQIVTSGEYRTIVVTPKGFEDNAVKGERIKNTLKDIEPVFESNTWYKNIEHGNFIYCRSEKDFCGFQHVDKEWYDEMYIPAFRQRFELVHEEEVEKLMISEAEKKGYKKDVKCKIKDKIPVILSEEGCLIFKKIRDLNYALYWVKENELTNYPIWSPKEGWAEIIKPLFVNSLGSKFYDGNTVYWVFKKDNLLHRDLLTESYAEIGDLKESIDETEALTLEQAEQYILDHRVFEDDTFYEVIMSGDKTIAEHTRGMFLMTGEAREYKKSDFDSIGEKITF